MSHPTLPTPSHAPPAQPGATGALAQARHRLGRFLGRRLLALRAAGTPVAVAAACFAALHMAWLASALGGAHRARIADLATFPMLLVAGLVAWRAGRDRALPGGVRRGWRRIGIGVTALGIGAGCYALGTFGLSPWRWLPDVAALVHYAFLSAGLATLGRAPRRGGAAARFWLDVGIVLLAGGAVVWSALLSAVAHDATPITTFAGHLDRLLTIVYPIASLGVLFGAASLLLHEPDTGDPLGARLTAELVAAGGLFAFAADLGSSWLSIQPGGYPSGAWPDASWTLAALLWLLGAEHARHRARRTARLVQAVQAAPADTRGAGATGVGVGAAAGDGTRPTGEQAAIPALAGAGRSGRPRPHAQVSVLPYVGIVVGYAALLLDLRDGQWTAATGGLLVIAAALTAAVVARQVLAGRENARLLALLAAREARFRAIFDRSPTSIFLVREDGELLESNQALQRLLGVDGAALRGRRAGEFVPPDDVRRVRAAAEELHRGRRSQAVLETRVRQPDGRMAWVHLTLAHADADGRPCLIGLAEDVTERKRLEAELVHQAFHDALTGLANRALFRDRVEHALARTARGGGGEVAVLFLDLDGFKSVNDSLGHDVGDRLLVGVAERLRLVTREADTVARLGGDEFAVLLEDVGAEAEGGHVAQHVAERIVEALERPFALAGREVRVAGSVGVAHARPGDGADALLRNADVAMYQAKHAGKGQVALYAPAMHAAALDRLELEADLRAAVERQAPHNAAGALSVSYQPLVTLATGAVRGFEALARWAHPTRGAVPPSVFIPLAEESGLIVPLGRWVLRTACAYAARWDALVPAGTPRDAVPGVHVNLSARQLQAPALLDDVRQALADSGLAPERLTLEITESVVMQDVEATRATLVALKALGVRLAIDDFGTGYSSLSQLQRFPVDELKIDKAFVDGVAHGSTEAALARTVIALGNTLHLRTVAEGIEHAEQEAVLHALGCDVGQGYLFAEPVRAEGVPALLAGVARG